jgi:hypothetical protein
MFGLAGQPVRQFGWIRAGGLTGAAVVAGLIAAASGAGVTGSVGAALDTATSSNTVEAQTANSRKAAQRGDESEAWRQIAVKEIKKEVKRDLRCSVQSYGQVQQFFFHHPCDKLDQQLFALRDGKGNIIAGSVVWVTMPSADSAAQFKQVEDTYGSGDVTPFGTEVLEMGGFHFSGKHYKSRVDGSLVVIAETDPAGGRPSDSLLNEVATVADVLPPL